MAAISVVIPCYNESASVDQLREKLLPVLDRLTPHHSIELLLIDDGSTDNTFELLTAAFGDRPATRIVRHPKNLNLGGAIRTGIRESTGELIANLDSDCTYDPALLEAMLRESSAAQISSPSHHIIPSVASRGSRAIVCS